MKQAKRPKAPAGIEDEPLPDDMLARMRPAHEILPDLVEAATKRGRPKLETAKEAVKLRLDPDVLAAYRNSGPGWQTRMNDALRKAAGLKKKAG